MKLALYIKDSEGKEPKMWCWVRNMRGTKARKVMAALLEACYPQCVNCEKAKELY